MGSPARLVSMRLYLCRTSRVYRGVLVFVVVPLPVSSLCVAETDIGFGLLV